MGELLVLDLLLSLGLALLVGTVHFLLSCSVGRLLSEDTGAISHKFVASVEIVEDWTPCSDLFHEILFTGLAVASPDVVDLLYFGSWSRVFVVLALVVTGLSKVASFALIDSVVGFHEQTC